MRYLDGSLVFSATDLVNDFCCSHLTSLNYELLLGRRSAPEFEDPVVDVLRTKGIEHEEQYVQYLRDQGYSVKVFPGQPLSAEAATSTLESMRDGYDVITQACLLEPPWGGFADVLLRVPGPSSLGSWSYEVIDTKLAYNTKPGTLLQLSLYSELLFRLQGRLPESMHVVTPHTGFEPQTFRVADYFAYFRVARQALEIRFVAGSTGDTYPDRVDHCRVCRWRDSCDSERRSSGNVSLVAGASRLQVADLRTHGVTNVAALSTSDLQFYQDVPLASRVRMERLRGQASVQLESSAGDVRHTLLLPQKPGVGLGALPAPSDGDLFFAVERLPFAGRNGLSYLFGCAGVGANGDLDYSRFWALTEGEEREAFEQFIDLAVRRRSCFPDSRIYHYGVSGPGGLARLATVHGTCESEVEKIVSQGWTFDLYPVVRDSVQVGVEQYSLEALEEAYSFRRSVPTQDAQLAQWELSSRAEASFGGVALDLQEEQRGLLEAYNRDRCFSAYALRCWLELLRSELVESGWQEPRPDPNRSLSTGLGDDVVDVIAQLLEGLPELPDFRRDETHGRWLLAQILKWHWKERLAVLDELARLSGCSSDELLEEGAALARLEKPHSVASERYGKLFRFSLPPQEISLRNGTDLVDRRLNSVGSFRQYDSAASKADLVLSDTGLAFAGGDLLAFADIGVRDLESSLLGFARAFAPLGQPLEGPYRVAADLLLRRPPVCSGFSDVSTPEQAFDAAMQVVRQPYFGVLPVQGPPGSGKTTLGARMICELIGQGRVVGLTAHSHSVITNLLEAVFDAAPPGLQISAVQKVSGQENPESDGAVRLFTSNKTVLSLLKQGANLVAGTAWFWSFPKLQDKVDVLFVDEAAQMSLANVLSSSRAARNLVLLGDPQQLDQPVRGVYPDGVAVSALGHLLGGASTLAPDQGIFLPYTFRLHPDICDFTSEVFYDGRLFPLPGAQRYSILSSGLLSGSGLRYIPVEHYGNRLSSPEEAEVVRALVEELLDGHSFWTDSKGDQLPLSISDVLIVAPYNSQVNRIQELLPEANVGTVDRFQGQEAPVVIYSMGSSSPAEASRGVEFLYSLNRLNVATSRAQCLCVLVASPALLHVECHTPREMQLVNALCRYRELATEIAL